MIFILLFFTLFENNYTFDIVVLQFSILINL